ncbi:MAG: alpha/beta fold hydrolase [Oceanococcus sp.]
MKLLIIAMALLIGGTSCEVSAEFLPSPEGQIHYDLQGPEDGAPVILVHGFSTPMWVWDWVPEALAAQGHRVLSFDLFGRGQSDKAKSEDSLDLFHGQIDALRAELGWAGPIDLIGLSMGGAVSTSYAAKPSTQVRRLVLIAPFNAARSVPILNVPTLGEFLARYVVVPISKRWGYKRSFNDPDAYFTAHPAMLERFNSSPQPADYSLALLSSLRNILSLDHIDAYKQVGKLGIPTFLFWGEQDQVVPFEEAPRVRAALGTPRFIEIDGAGHMPHLEQRQIVEPALVQFLNTEVPAAGNQSNSATVIDNRAN